MRNGFRALGVASIAAVQVATGQTAWAAEQNKVTVAEEPNQLVERAEHEDFASPGSRRAIRQGARQMRGICPTRLPPEAALAACLTILETRIGIRSEQLDAWRDYTSALQALLPPPGPRRFDPSEPRLEAIPGRPRTASEAAIDPFAREEALADNFVKRAAVAQKLKASIAALRTTLTPEQLEILASAFHLWGPGLDSGVRGGPPEDAAGPGGGPQVGHP